MEEKTYIKFHILFYSSFIKVVALYNNKCANVVFKVDTFIIVLYDYHSMDSFDITI